MKRSDSKGITLIALVITIIVLLILAGVTIATLAGDNGILTRANEAKTNTDIGEEKEAIGIAYNGLKIENEGTGITAGELKQELNRNGRTDVKDVTGENPIIVEFNSGRIYTIDNNGNIEELIEEPITGNYYDKDTDITVRGKPVTIPGGATISGIESETDISKGLVIYITNGEEITDWEAAKTTYDQFVWVPVKDAVAVDMNGDKTVDEKDIDLMIEQERYPMAIETGDGNYRGVLYEFEESEEGNLIISDMSYSATSEIREPDEIRTDSSNGISEETLQEQFNLMVGRVAEKGGFWVGRYETTGMISKSSTIDVIKGKKSGINNATWYIMYDTQKAYKNKVLRKSDGTTSSMIWGSQWNQIMIWMKDVPSVFTNDKYTGKFYITNAVGMGNHGVDNTGTRKDTTQVENTGCYDVKNIYDLAGNVEERTLMAYDDFGRNSYRWSV